MVFQIYNTLSREIEPFIPIDDMKVNIYVCGPTVYDYSHVGHARTYLSYDVIIRYLEYKGYRTRYVVNITDVNDKIIARAQETGQDPLELARKFDDIFREDMKALQIRTPDVFPRVTEHMPDIIRMINSLIQKGYAYESEGDVYFRVTKIDDFGKLSKQSLDQMLEGTDAAHKTKKESPYDFALWKSAKSGEQSWESPWSRGRPGWHIECSAMSMKYFGSSFDIHGGANELVFPHHENEIAQSEATTGKKPFVKYWIHTGILTINSAKMSKSLGNYVRIRDLLARFDPEAFRLFVLSTHYRRPVEFSDKAMEQAENALRKIYETRDRLRQLKETDCQKTLEGERLLEEMEHAKRLFFEAMDNDLNTAIALANFHEIVRIANRAIESGSSGLVAAAALQTIDELGAIFGLFQIERHRGEISNEIKGLIAERDEARSKKNWKRADEIRTRLKEMGVILRDTPQGTEWLIEEASSVKQ